MLTRTQTCARRYGCYSQKRKCQLLEGRAGRIDLNIASIGTKVSISWYRIDTFVVVPLLHDLQRLQLPHSFSQSPKFCYHCTARLETSSSLLMAVPLDRPLEVRKLGVILDPTVSFQSHIKSITKSAFPRYRTPRQRQLSESGKKGEGLSGARREVLV